MIYGTVAIVGRPNVGKSTLFNQLTRKQGSIIADQPGVTRDRIYGTVYYDPKKKDAGFTLIDTGGFETDQFHFQPFAENLVWSQSQQAIREADLVLLVLDGKHGLHQHDRTILQYLKQHNKNFLLLVNKVDGEERDSDRWEFYALGAGDPISISAAHNKGLWQLLETIRDNLASQGSLRRQADDNIGTKIALIGRPNAGKSSLLNRLIGEDRCLVSPVAGTTRDSIDTPFTYNHKPWILIDTAGIRRKTKVREQLEVRSVIRSLRAIERADMVMLVIDALEGLTDQDTRLIHLAIDRFRPVMIVVNKWDLVPDKTANTARDYARNLRETSLADMDFIPITFVSCVKNQRVHQLMQQAEEVYEQSSRKAGTAKVNESLQKMILRHSPQLIQQHSKRIKFYYATQVTSSPPTMVVMCNVADEIQPSYRRYMLRSFRKDLGFDKVPVRIFFRGKQEKRERKLRSEEADTGS
ncbi:MAG: ribosome biogenesis GTPase Der [Deltaproteobacteria bacterium]|nr:ribosome biogenesis GTPase Der [Deltaproteobacteria bacterium]